MHLRYTVGCRYNAVQYNGISHTVTEAEHKSECMHSNEMHAFFFRILIKRIAMIISHETYIKVSQGPPWDNLHPAYIFLHMWLDLVVQILCFDEKKSQLYILLFCNK